MAIYKLLVPQFSVDIQEATIKKWYVKEGDKIEKNIILLELETDNAIIEIPSQINGVISKIYFQNYDIVFVGSILAEIKKNTQ